MSKKNLIEKLEKTKTKNVGVRVNVSILNELDSIINEVNKNDKNVEADRSKMINIALDEFVKTFRKN